MAESDCTKPTNHLQAGEGGSLRPQIPAQDSRPRRSLWGWGDTGSHRRGQRLGQPPDTGTHAYRDELIEQIKDLSRSIDYLETRPDTDHSRLAYYGISWGSEIAPIPLATILGQLSSEMPHEYATTPHPRS